MVQIWRSGTTRSSFVSGCGVVVDDSCIARQKQFWCLTLAFCSCSMLNAASSSLRSRGAGSAEVLGPLCQEIFEGSMLSEVDIASCSLTHSAHIMASRLTRSAPSMAALSALESALASFRISQPSIGAVAKRHASHQAQGRANGAKDGPGKRLGAKKTGGQYVVPGNIIFRQRGTLWFPGDNCFMVSAQKIFL